MTTEITDPKLVKRWEIVKLINRSSCSFVHFYFQGLVTSSLLFLSDLEWILSESRAIKTELEEDPRKRRQIKDVMTSSLRSGGQYNPDDDDDDDSD